MTPEARYAAAICVLDQWLSGKPAEQALTGWARGARYAGSKDRAAVRDHVFDILRCLSTCQTLGGEVTGRALVIGLLRMQGKDPETVFSGRGHAPAPLANVERAIEASADPVADIPQWTLPHFQERFGDDLEAFARSMQTRAPLYLRVNSRKATMDDAQRSLADDGIHSRFA